MRKLSLVLVCVVGLIGCGENTDTTGFYTGQGVLKNHSWNDYHWGDLTPTVTDNTRAAMWSGQTELYVNHWAGLGTPIQPQMTTSKKAEVAVVEGFSNDWLGLAQIYLQNGHIVKGKVSLNTTLLSDSAYAPEAAAHVLCQELGHIWGLDHNRDALDTCMNDCVTQPTYVEWMACLNTPAGEFTNDHDTEELLSIYGHTDTVEDAGTSSPGGPDCNAKPNHPRCGASGWVVVHETPVYGHDENHD